MLAFADTLHEMSKAYEFLKECRSFFVLSINGEYPAGRPFGAVGMEHLVENIEIK